MRSESRMKKTQKFGKEPFKKKQTQTFAMQVELQRIFFYQKKKKKHKTTVQNPSYSLASSYSVRVFSRIRFEPLIVGNPNLFAALGRNWWVCVIRAKTTSLNQGWGVDYFSLWARVDLEIHKINQNPVFLISQLNSSESYFKNTILHSIYLNTELVTDRFEYHI